PAGSCPTSIVHAPASIATPLGPARPSGTVTVTDAAAGSSGQVMYAAAASLPALEQEAGWLFTATATAWVTSAGSDTGSEKLNVTRVPARSCPQSCTAATRGCDPGEKRAPMVPSGSFCVDRI